MKKHLIMAALLLSCCLTSFGQQQVTTFMGMPVDGLKKNMSHQLVEKGFRRVPGEDCLEGEFNGENVYIYIQTVKNKVWRIVVSGKSTRDEAQIKVRFNNLCYQFKNNERYTSFGDKEQTIPEDEDIGYEMEVKNKRYQATFYQDDDHVMTEEEFSLEKFNRCVWFTIIKNGNSYHLAIYYENEYNQANGEDL